MEANIINTLLDQVDRINQRWARTVNREWVEGAPELRKKLLEMTRDHIELAIHILEDGKMAPATEYAEEVAHKAHGLNIQLGDIFKAFHFGKKVILDKIAEAIPEDAQALIKAVREIEEVYAAFEFGLAGHHWRFDEARASEDTARTSKRDEELRHLQRRMGEVERAGRTMSEFGIHVMLLDKQRRVLWANRAVRKQAEELGEVCGWTCGQVRGVPEGICEDCPTSWAIRNKIMERGMVSTSRGKEREFHEVTALPILNEEGGVDRVLELIQDVSFKFRLAEEKRQNEEYYRILFEHSGTAVCVLEPDKTISKVNRRFCQLSGYARDEIEGKISFLGIVAEPERKRMGQYHERRRINPLGAPSSYEFTFLKKDKEERRANITVGLVPGTMQSICSIRDVTEEEQTKEFLEAVLYNSADAIIGLDNDLKIVSWNFGAENLFGYRTKEIIGRGFSALWLETPERKVEFESVVKAACETGFVKNHESEMITRFGEMFIVSLTMSLLRDRLGKVRGFSVIVRDITEQKALEQQVIQVEKLAAIGQLTAGLAHEMGTPLNIVSGRAEYLLSDLSENDPRRESLQTIIHQSERMTKLIDNLLKFSRPQRAQYAELDLPEVLDGVLSLLETQMEKSNVGVDIQVSPDLPPVEADYYQLQQVLLNIILNSIQAMPNGGQMSIEIKSPDPNWTRVIIADTGVGIPQENIPRIFDPFFTTKESGQGTGLGLAIVSKIVRDHGGSVKVESVVGKGASFSISLPVSHSVGEAKTA